MSSSGSNSIWLLAAPGYPTKQEAIEKLKDKISNRNADYATITPFQLPDFKVKRLPNYHTKPSIVKSAGFGPRWELWIV